MAPRSKRDPSRDDLRAQIRRTGLRATTSRITVLARVIASAAPVSHAEVADALEPQGFDRATVYRNLVDLADAGLLTRSDLGDHVWRFEARGASHHAADHLHFVCTDCGEISCLPEIQVVFAKTDRSPRAVRNRNVELQLKGLCDHCG